MLNMADKWLEAVEKGAEAEALESRVSAKDYKKYYLRAAKMHHPDRKGSEEAQIFLNTCIEMLCGTQKCQAYILGDADAERKKTYIRSLSLAWKQCPKMKDSISPGTPHSLVQQQITRCFQDSTASANQEMLKSKPSAESQDKKQTQQQRSQPVDDEEIIVFVDNTRSFREGTRLHDAKQFLKRLWPEFERTRTSFHFIGGSCASVAANEFKDRVEAAGGQYENTVIRATLLWNKTECVDLDLHIIEPSGFEIYFGSKISNHSRGFLDVDAGVGGHLCESEAGPVENIRWLVGSQPLEGVYYVKVRLYSKSNQPSVDTVSFKVEVQVEGMSNDLNWQIFDGRLSDEGEILAISSFEYTRGGQKNGVGRTSTEVIESSTVPDMTYLDKQWKADAWSTYLWKYAYDVLLQKGQQGMKKWRALFLVDGYDNDSPGQFQGPTGYNEMMNQLFRNHVRPEINIVCFGSEECDSATSQGRTDADNPWLALALYTGGSFTYVPENPSKEVVRISLDDFSKVFSDTVVNRIQHRIAAQQRWLELAPSANVNQEYTKELQLINKCTMTHDSACITDDEDIFDLRLRDLPAQYYRSKTTDSL